MLYLTTQQTPYYNLLGIKAPKIPTASRKIIYYATRLSASHLISHCAQSTHTSGSHYNLYPFWKSFFCIFYCFIAIILTYYYLVTIFLLPFNIYARTPNFLVYKIKIANLQFLHDGSYKKKKSKRRFSPSIIFQALYDVWQKVAGQST